MLNILTTCVVLLPITAFAVDHTRPLVFTDRDRQERPVKTAGDWARRRATILDGMQQAMGPLPDRSDLPPLDVVVTEQVKGDGFTRVTLSFLAQGKDRVPADLYLPADSPNTLKRRSAMLALHQTSPRGRRDLEAGSKNPNMGYAPELARRGYVVLCPDYPSFGDYAYDFAKDDYVSGSMKGVFNHMRCVDLLRSRDDVDPERIGVIGHSLGGHNAMFLAVFDERVKAVVTSCGWTPFGDYYGGNITGWTSDRYMPRLKDVYGLDPKRVPFDFQELVAAIAPRWFFSSSPVGDANFAVAGVKKAESAARPVFELLGASDRLKIVYPDCAHDFPSDVRQQAFAFLDKALANTPAGDADYAAELPRIPPKEPAEALKTFHVLPGFRIEQVAAEPLVRDPIAMSFDENGRLFVVEMVDYSEQDKDFLGSIRMLEDADGDGKFDKSTVYADKLSWPTALICSGGGVFVGAAPDIYWLKDTDGDGKADERKTVFTGFERTNVQGLINSFHWTLDNRIHGATSLSGGRVRRPDVPNAPELNLNGRDFSFDPKTLEMRAESGGAQHGLTFDDWGRKFVCSNSDHIQMVMFEDRYLARNASLAAPSPRVSIAADGGQAKVFRISPVEPWRIVRTRLRVAGIAPGPIEGGGTPAGYFTGATGTTIYRGDAFPPEYRAQAFIGDVGSNIVHRKVLEPSGVGFTAKRVDENCEFVASTDNWFRPCQFANAPDGTLYIADMYREVIEHPASLPPEIKKHLDLTSGRDRGRIYRVVPEGYRQRPPTRLGAVTTEQLVATLEHRNGWHRDTAARLIYERADAFAVAPLEKLARESKLPEARVHALYALAGLGRLSPSTVLAALADPEARVREHAARLSERVAAPPADLWQAVGRLADDADARVRYQAAFSLGTAPGERSAPLARLLKRDGEESWIRLAAMSSSAEGAGDLLATLLADDAWTKSAAAASLVPYLASQAASRDGGRGIAQLAPLLDSLAARNTDLAEAAVAEIAVAATSARTVEGTDTGERLRAVRASVLAKARAVAANPSSPAAARARAIRTLVLGTLDGTRDLLTAALEARQPHEVQLAALSTLDRLSNEEADAVLVAAWRGLSPRLRTSAAEVMFAQPGRAARFLRAAEAGKVPMSDLDPSRLKRLEASDDVALHALAQKLLASRALGRREDVVAKYRPALELTGDAGRGRTIFRNTCAGCHRLENFGAEIGPNLSAMANRGAEAVLVNVLDPNREVTPQFVDYVVETNDGRTLTGMLAAETANSVTLKRAENAADTVLRSDIRRMRSGQVSIMPEGLEQQIDVQGMADLIAYVMGAK